ncbi:mechanosensitive ion channel [bacterium]|nr:mechanosensitive ion channel [bacterium]MBQ6436072.1 mechanosensitive ion channel [bacterium]
MTQFIQNISQFLHLIGFSNQQIWLLAALIWIFIISFSSVCKKISLLIIVTLTKHTHSKIFEPWLNTIEKISRLYIVINSFILCLMITPVPASVIKVLLGIFLLINITLSISLIKSALTNILKFYFATQRQVSAEAAKTVINFSNVIVTIILWLATALFVMRLADIDTGALLSGLGVASIIVAFSSQNLLKDIFSFFSIYIDRSFNVGDYITFDKYAGTITEIRLRTTRIKALLGNELIVANDKLTSSVIENYGRLKTRRVAFTFKVDSHISTKTLNAVIKEIKETFTKPEFSERLTLNSVVVEQLTEYGIQIKIIYRFTYVPGQKNFYQHLEAKEKVNLAIMDILAKHDVSLVQLLY